MVQDGLILRGDRVVIPKSPQKGNDRRTTRSTPRNRIKSEESTESIYWPNMNSEVKDYISRCEICLTYPPRQQKEPLQPHEVPDRRWGKVATDLFQFENKDYPVTVDYFSNFFEVDRMYSTTSDAVIKKLKRHIATYGIPDE